MYYNKDGGDYRERRAGFLCRVRVLYSAVGVSGVSICMYIRDGALCASLT